MKTPWIIAHRGGAGHAPENTFAAFEKSVALGAQFIETDLQVTRDGRFVAIHDNTLNRTTNGEGAVSGATLAEVSQRDAGLWYDRGYAGQRVPVLEEILHFAHHHDVVFYLEVKPDVSRGMASALVAALQASKAVSRTIVISADPGMLVEVRKLDPSIMAGVLVEERREDAVNVALEAGARQLCPRFTMLTPELVQKAHAADLQVVTWTVNQREDMDAMIAAGVDGIMTDFPDRLRAVLEHMHGTVSDFHREPD